MVNNYILSATHDVKELVKETEKLKEENKFLYNSLKAIKEIALKERFIFWEIDSERLGLIADEIDDVLKEADEKW